MHYFSKGAQFNNISGPPGPLQELAFMWSGGDRYPRFLQPCLAPTGGPAQNGHLNPDGRPQPRREAPAQTKNPSQTEGPSTQTGGPIPDGRPKPRQEVLSMGSSIDRSIDFSIYSRAMGSFVNPEMVQDIAGPALSQGYTGAMRIRVSYGRTTDAGWIHGSFLLEKDPFWPERSHITLNKKFKSRDFLALKDTPLRNPWPLRGTLLDPPLDDVHRWIQREGFGRGQIPKKVDK